MKVLVICGTRRRWRRKTSDGERRDERGTGGDWGATVMVMRRGCEPAGSLNSFSAGSRSQIPDRQQGSEASRRGAGRRWAR